MPAFRARQAADRDRGIYRGLGICSVVEPTTYGSAFYKAAGIAGSGHEAAWVKVAPSGSVEASVGLMGSGQGYETALAQAVAAGLGVAAERCADADGQHRYHTPSLHTPTGSKGMSEGGVMGAVGAVCSAVTDALAPFGVVVERQPLTPQAVHALLAKQRT